MIKISNIKYPISNIQFQISNFKYWWLLIPGILLRIFLAASTFHPDIRAFNLGGELVASGNILNLYDYLAGCSIDNPLLKTFGADLFIYPPLIYLLHGAFNFLFSLLFGSQVMNSFLIDQAAFFGNSWFNFHLLLLKAPYFLFDLPAAFWLAGLFETRKEKIWAFGLWVFNPITLYSSYMMGQFDLLPAVFTILSLWLIKRKMIYFAALALGLGVAFKLYPLFLVVPFVLISRKWIDRFILAVLSVLPYLLTIIPFLPSHGFRAYALMAGLTQKTLFAQIPVSGGESLLLFPLVIGVMYFFFWYQEQPAEKLWRRWFAVLLAFYIFTHFHPQWLSWLTPFIVIELVSSKGKNWLVHAVMLLCYVGMIFLFDPSLTVKIFAPLIPNLYLLPGTWGEFGVRFDDVFIRSFLQTFFAASCVYFIYRNLSNERRS